MSPERMKNNRSGNLRDGFTMIELMVVIGIIIMASAIMGPTLADFMKNRQLEGVRGQFGRIFNLARQQAVNMRRDMSVVFFREGPRVYDELKKGFIPDGWRPDKSPLGEIDPTMWYVLGFARGTSSQESKDADEEFSFGGGLSIPPYKKWLALQGKKTSKSKRSSRKSRSRRTSSGLTSDDTTKYNTTGLLKITYNRNGTLVFSDGGSDIPTSVYNGEGSSRPKTADLVILQLDAKPSCFIDLRPTGQVRSKIVTLEQYPRKVGEVTAIYKVENEKKPSGRSSRSRSRK